MSYVDELIRNGLAISFISFRTNRDNNICVAKFIQISDKGKRLMEELFSLVRKHKLSKYVRYSVVNGLYVLNDDTRDLLYALAKLEHVFEKIEKKVYSRV